MVKWQDIQDVVDGNRRRRSRNSHAGVLALGAAIGAAAGMLLAPHSGKVTRSRIKRKTRDEVDKGKGMAHDVKEDIKDKAHDAKDIVADTKDAAKSAVDEGKKAAKESQENSRSSGRR